MCPSLKLYLYLCLERKYEDISRKMATLDADAARGNERADGAEKKILDLEEELKVEYSLGHKKYKS